MSPTEERPHQPPHGVNDAYLGRILTRPFALGTGILVLCVLVLIKACESDNPGPGINAVINSVGGGYTNYILYSGEGPFTFDSEREFVARLQRGNRRHTDYLMLPPDWYDEEGLIIDNWGRRLRITQLPEDKIRVRSAGRDGRFGTADDCGRDYPWESEIKLAAERKKKAAETAEAEKESAERP